MNEPDDRAVVTKALQAQVGSSINLRGTLVVPDAPDSQSGTVHFNVLDQADAKYGRHSWNYRIESSTRGSQSTVTFFESDIMNSGKKKSGSDKKLVIRGDVGVINALSAVRSRPRIVGGEESAEGAWPWMTAIYYRNCSPEQCQFCGGSLIAPNWVLTAAHCAAAVGNTPIDVFLGGVDLAGQGTQIRVDQVIVHEDFDPNTLDNDIALLHLSQPAGIKPVVMIESGDPDGLTDPDNMAKMLGWGATSEGGPGSQLLMEVEVNILTNAAANQALAPFGSRLTANMLPAGVPGGGKDTCQGDSGGPFLVRDGSRRWVLAGVTSWGIGCARPNLPGIYARVANYREWIDEIVGDTSLQPTDGEVIVDSDGETIIINIKKGDKPIQINIS